MGVLPGVVMAVALAVAGPSAVGTAAAIEIDLRVDVDLASVVADIDRACTESRRVPVRVVSGDEAFEVRFECARIAADRQAAVWAELVNGVEDFHDAGDRADRVLAVERALPRSDRIGYARENLVWSFAGLGLDRCTRTLRPKTIREWMAQAAESNWETPERWTMIEAIPLAGACPEHLDDLYRNVRRAGEPEAARAVERRIERALPAK